MRIALFFDGTWNAPLAFTNIHALFRRTPEIPGEQHRRYFTGVGTKPPYLLGAVTGLGLDEKIVAGYAEIVRHWRDADDQIFLFGFSRGAFTARSLAGMIAKCGIVPPGALSAQQVFDRYRDTERPGLREMVDDPAAIVTDQDALVRVRARQARIRFIGVFDTVGSLGLPGPFAGLTAGRYRFHDTDLSGLVDIARHAVALDELRSYFPPTLWTAVPKPVGAPPSVEQRWYVGGHSNVGGGPTTGLWLDHQLSTLPRRWIATEARLAGLRISLPAVAPDAEFGRIERADHSPLFAPIGLLPKLGFAPRHVRDGGIDETLAGSVRARWCSDVDYRVGSPPRAIGLRQWI